MTQRCQETLKVRVARSARLLHAARVQGGVRELRGDDALGGSRRAGGDPLEAGHPLGGHGDPYPRAGTVHQFQRNEVASRALSQCGQRAMSGDPYFVEEDRQQRNTLALRDVDYIIEAHFLRTPKWGPEDTMGKHVEVVTCRLEKGQTFHQPYLGCREFAAVVEPVVEVPRVGCRRSGETGISD